MNFNTKNVCRTCVRECESLSKINGTDIALGSNTASVLGLLNLLSFIELDEGLPDLICLNCLDKVTDIYKFKIQCDNSNILLEQYLAIKNECQIKDIDPSDGGISETELELDSNRRKQKSRRVKKKRESNKREDTSEVISCKECNESFKTPDKLSTHEKCHQRGECFCELCNAQFVAQCGLNRHLKIVHNVVKEEEEHVCLEQISSYVCKICNKIFASKYILAVHEKRHLYKGNFLCPICGKGFNSKGCLNRHNRVHTGEKKYECQVCKKKFPSSNNLNLHSRIHTGVKPYLCTICGKSFTHPTGLTYHTRTHTKEKNYHCDLCDMSFAIRCHLENHRKRHTGERPFTCSQCDKAFIKKVDLQRHEAVHGGVKPHVCSICDKEFLRPLHLSYHMMIHTEERPHKCAYCGKGFIRKYYLKDHMKKHHDVTDFPSTRNELDIS
ncbi:hypothetical protein JTB14_036183 [Gonioctena quinquepunctata]|nr:hypothetical protein JTB14_036183 [Gonioctena quinquepunctata]